MLAGGVQSMQQAAHDGLITVSWPPNTSHIKNYKGSVHETKGCVQEPGSNEKMARVYHKGDDEYFSVPLTATDRQAFQVMCGKRYQTHLKRKARFAARASAKKVKQGIAARGDMFAQIAAIAKEGQRSSREDSRDQAKVVSYLGEDEAEEASDDDSARKRTSKKRCLSRSKKTMRSSAKKRRRAESDDAEDDAQQEEEEAQSKPRKFKVGGTRSKPGGVSTQEKRKRFQAKRRKPIGVSRDDSVGAEDADGSDGDAPQPEVMTEEQAAFSRKELSRTPATFMTLSVAEIEAELDRRWARHLEEQGRGDSDAPADDDAQLQAPEEGEEEEEGEEAAPKTALDKRKAGQGKSEKTCKALTKKDEPCMCKPKPGSDYCGRHEPKLLNTPKRLKSRSLKKLMSWPSTSPSWEELAAVLLVGKDRSSFSNDGHLTRRCPLRVWVNTEVMLKAAIKRRPTRLESRASEGLEPMRPISKKKMPPGYPHYWLVPPRPKTLCCKVSRSKAWTLLQSPDRLRAVVDAFAAQGEEEESKVPWKVELARSRLSKRFPSVKDLHEDKEKSDDDESDESDNEVFNNAYTEVEARAMWRVTSKKIKKEHLDGVIAAFGVDGSSLTILRAKEEIITQMFNETDDEDSKKSDGADDEASADEDEGALDMACAKMEQHVPARLKSKKVKRKHIDGVLEGFGVDTSGWTTAEAREEMIVQLLNETDDEDSDVCEEISDCEEEDD